MDDSDLRRPGLWPAFGPVLLVLARTGLFCVAGSVMVLVVLALIEGSPPIK